LDHHVEWSLGEIGQTSCPLDSARSVLWITGYPVSKTDIHGCLGVVLAANGISEIESADDIPIDRPCGRFLGPVHGVRLESSFWCRDWMELTTVIGCGVSLAKVIALSLRSIASNPFL
jgi:hypothetical protein